MSTIQSKILVTGANGLTGSAVVRALLSRGFKVRAMIQPGTNECNLDGLDVEKVYANILDKKSLEKALDGVDIVHHVAAIFEFATNPIIDPIKYAQDCSRLYRNNLEGTTSLLLAANKTKIKKIIYTSTMACIGVAPGKQLSDETLPFDIWLPVNDYMRSKGFAEAIVYQFIESGAPVVIVNPTWTVGPGDINPTPVGEVVLDVINGREPKVSPAGINIVDVDDVGLGHVLAQEKGKIGERYILGGENVEYIDFLNKIRLSAGLSSLKSQEEVNSSFPKDYLWYDSNKARRDLGWEPRPLDETVSRAVNWFKTKK